MSVNETSNSKKESINNNEVLTTTITKKQYKEILNWSYDDAVRAEQACGGTYGQWKGSLHKRPISLWFSIKKLKRYNQEYINGDISKLLHALSLCFSNNLPIPEWCASGIVSSVQKITNYQEKSWDHIFGKPHPKGIHLSSIRNKNEKQTAVYTRITDILEYEPTPITVELFERVGREFSICKTLAEKYYYETKHNLKEGIKIMRHLHQTKYESF